MRIERRMHNREPVYIVDEELMGAVIAVYEHGLMYGSFLSHEGDSFVAVDNTCGEAYTEVFRTETAALEWLTMRRMTAEAAHELDERLYNERRE